MCRILFLEDEADPVEHLPLLLREKRIEVSGTTSIAEALERLRGEPFDAVLLDIMMPPAEDMDAEALAYGRETGVEVARRMKAIRPEVPIIALTVTTDKDIQTRMWQAGIVEILNKPAETDLIAEVLLRHGRRRRN